MHVVAASFTQHYTPVADNVILSALVAALPIIVLLGLLGLLRVKAHIAALAGLGASLLVAIVVFGMPVETAAAAATNGAAFGLFPIGWIVLCAIFVYDITVKTGKFEEVRRTIAGLAVDRRIQVLLIAFSFGAFIEGIVVGGVATGQEGSEGNILRYVFFHSIALACLVGLLVLAQAYVFPGVVP
jgi:lactate permease